MLKLARDSFPKCKFIVFLLTFASIKKEIVLENIVSINVTNRSSNLIVLSKSQTSGVLKLNKNVKLKRKIARILSTI